MISGASAGSAKIVLTGTDCTGQTLSTTSSTITVYGAISAAKINNEASGSSNVCCGSTLSLTGSYSGGSAAYNPQASWSSSDSTNFPVNASGQVTPSVTGSATIYYTVTDSCGGSIQATRTINSRGKVTNANISGSSDLCCGSTATLTGSYSTNNATGISASWSSSTASVSLSNTGLTSATISGVSVGSSVITYTVTDGCGGSTSKAFTVNVRGHISNASVSPASKTVFTGETTTLTGSYTNASGYNVSTSWQSSNTNVATVTSAGVVSGISAGSATITYTVTDSCESISATASITVIACTPPSSPSISGLSNLCPGETATGTCTYSGGNPTPSKTWSSSNTSVATVNSSGVVTAVAAGSTTIYCVVANDCGSVTASTSVTVYSVPSVSSISGNDGVSGCSANGLTIQLTANYTAGSHPSESGAWSITAGSVASVNSSGLVTFTGAGSVTVTYTRSGGCSSSSASKTVTATQCSAPTSASISGNSSTSSTGCSYSSGQTISLTGSSAGASCYSVSHGWSLSDSTVAQLSSTSTSAVTVTFKKAGSVDVTYTATNSCGSKSATKTLTNTFTQCSAPTGVSISGNSSVGSTGCSYVSGQTIALTGNSEGSSCYSITHYWEISNTTIATLSSTNTSTVTVTFKSAGSVDVTYTATNSCGSKSTTKTLTNTFTPYTSPTVTSISGNDSVQGCNPSGLQITLTANYTAGSHPSESGAWSISAGSVASVNQSGVVTFTAAGSVTVRYTRSGGCSTSYAEKTVTAYQCSAPTSASIAGNNSVSSTGCSYASGQTISLTASNGGASCYGVTDSWSLTGNAATISYTGTSAVVTFSTTGSVDVTYTATNSCGSKTSAVKTLTNSFTQCSAPTGASISGSSSTGYTGCTYVSGQTVGLTGSSVGATCYDVSHAWSITGGAATLSSTNTSSTVVTFSTTGSVTVTYTATNSCGSKSTTKTITNSFLQYTSPSVTSISGNATVSGCSANGLTIQLTANYTAGTHPSESGAWSITAGSVATVNQSGLVTFSGAGCVTVRYTRSGGCSTSYKEKEVCAYQCSAPTSASISGDNSVSSSACTYSSGQTISLTASTAGATCYGVSDSWSLTGNAATISYTGKNAVVTFSTTGSVDVTYTATNSCGSKTSAAKTLTNTFTQYVAPSSPTISGLSTLCVGSSANASCSYSGGFPTPSKTWSSSNTSVATVDSSGKVTAVTGGSATIYCVVSNLCGTVTGSTSVVVYNKISGATLNKSSHAGCPGTTVQLSVANTSPSNLSSTAVTWASNNEAVATVNSSGLVTLVTGGSATITATVTDSCGSNATASCVVTVTKTVTGASLSGGDVIYNGGTLTLTTGYTPSDAAISSKSLSGGNAYLSVGSTNAVTGLTNATGNSSQNVTVTFTATDECGNSKQATTTVTVRQHVTAATLSLTSVTVDVAKTVTLTPGFSPANAYGVSYSWSSNDTSVATVSNGVVTGVKKGTATVTLTATDGAGTQVTKSCTVTVKNPDVTGITVPSAVVRCICGSTATASVSVTPSSSSACANITGWTVTNTDGIDSVLSQGKITVENTPETSSGFKSGSTITITGAKAGLARVNVTAKDDNGQSASSSFIVLITTEVSEDSEKIGRRAWLNEYRLPMFNESDTKKCPTKEELLAAAQRGNLATYTTLTIGGDYDDIQTIKQIDVTVTGK